MLAALRTSAALALVLSFSACSGSRPAADAPPATVTYPDESPAPAPVYEAPAPAPTPTYEAPAPAPTPTYEAPAPRQVNGYRVQVYASQVASGGEQKRAEATRWWEGEQRRTGFRAPLDAYVVYLDGLYKVRMGAFTNRQDAESALTLVRTRFPDAFLVPDLVTIDG